MKLYYSIVVLCALICLCSCKSGNSDAPQDQQPETELTEVETSELYRYYHSDPQSQQQREENMIIEYADEQNLSPQRTAEGIYYVIHKQGEGPLINYGQPVEVHYKGYFFDGREFDSSYKRNKPIKFRVGNMIAGWNKALQLMNPGTEATLLIPSELAYGNRGYPGLIPPDTPLAFDIKILSAAENID